MAENISTIEDYMMSLNIVDKIPDGAKNEDKSLPDLCEDHSSDDELLDEFLTLKAKRRIHSLQSSNKNLENILIKLKRELLIIKKKLETAEKQEKILNKELEVSKREVYRKESQIKKKTLELKTSLGDLSQKSQLCQDLNKDIQNLKKELTEEKKKNCSFETQNSALKLQIKRLNEVIQKDRICYEKNQEKLEASGVTLEETNRILKRQMCDLALVVKEQQKLIDVLQQQKAAILGANVAINMEKEFKEIVQSVCSNSEK